MSERLRRGITRANPLFLRDKELRQALELLFLAHQDFAIEVDSALQEFGFGRAHHRVIYFVGANPGIAVGELLIILKITKQSLSRVLNQLLVNNFLYQKIDLNDRRRKQLFLTSKGESLETLLTTPQLQKIAKAFQHAGIDAVDGFRKVMCYLVNTKDQN